MKVNIDVSKYTEADEIANRVWHEGYRAFVDGKSGLKNPYKPLADAYCEWCEGWEAARETKKESTR